MLEESTYLENNIATSICACARASSSAVKVDPADGATPAKQSDWSRLPAVTLHPPSRLDRIRRDLYE